MPGIAEFFAPGNIQQIYKEELKRFVEEQSTRITERAAKKIREAASLCKELPQFYDLSESFIYPENLSELRESGTRVFRFRYKYKCGLYEQQSSWFVMLVLEESLADSFENKVLKPWLPTNSTTYDYVELH